MRGAADCLDSVKKDRDSHSNVGDGRHSSSMRVLQMSTSKVAVDCVGPRSRDHNHSVVYGSEAVFGHLLAHFRPENGVAHEASHSMIGVVCQCHTQNPFH